ncbi:hypothetical protein NM688_g4940 [Phlebia brevispora]|uniref:Uncharacterized protein n=1 Tax=Phlebia brevispora TaxID=194682 RepID=A0ACC1T1M6_9APHY|nr:hypothetical protein NM688_g4940 [Phlebia brevispora]
MATNTNTNIATSEYARRRRELFDITKALRDFGADALLGRPRIAVIGGQSTGKSSLVEAVTGITVPRDSGTCTRCPMECSIRGGTSSWACQISLLRTNSNNTSTSAFGARISNKEDVELNIRRAQAAILNPHLNSDSFLDKSYDELKSLAENNPRMLRFSRDTVVVDIEDPDGTDLFFVDLPGLIQNAAQDADIDIVRTLVEDYIAEPQTIILITIPAIDDIENQQAVRLARIADPEGTRTIGVITKPDSLTAGAIGLRTKWENIIKGVDRAHTLRLGFYCVRLPDDAERTHSRDEMECIATEFLRTTPPWSSLHNTSRLGVRALVSDISELLMSIIEQSLPDILAKLEGLISECEKDLEDLPEPITVDPATEILNRIISFCRDLQAIVSGQSEDKGFVHRNRAVYEKFNIAIRKTAPNFQPFEDLDKYVLGEDPTLAQDLNTEERPDTVMPPMDLYDVRRVIKESTGWELPRNIPYGAKVTLIRRSIELWSDPTSDCCDEIMTILRGEVDKQISEHFGRFRHLESHIGPIVRNYAVQVSVICKELVGEVLGREDTPYFTQNLHYLDSVYGKWLRRYKSARHNPQYYLITPPGRVEPPVSRSPSGLSYCPSPEEDILSILARLGYPGLKNEDLARLRPDAFEAELCVMADVRAYFQVAYKRVIDNIPLTIQRSLCQKLADTLQAHLVDKLKLGSPDASRRFDDLLAEDPRVQLKREELRTQLKQLREIQEKLQNF